MENELIAQARMLPQEFEYLITDTWVIMPNWKWLALIAATVLSFLGRPLLQMAARRLKKSLNRRKDQKSFLGYLQQLPIESPISWIILTLLWHAVIDGVQFPPTMSTYLSGFTKLVMAFHVLRLIYMAVDAMGFVLSDLAAKTETELDDQLAPFATKTLKLLVVVLGTLMVLQNFGVNVMGLLAGLGLGGLALALAAQDTAANLFGSVTILFDSPFKVGDWIKVGDTEGNVEEIGFRSTRVRTFYNSVVTLPNSTMAKEKIDNMGMRPRRRVRQILGLTYDTPTAKIQEFCDSVRAVLMQEKKVDPAAVVVTFMNFGASTLDILVNFHLIDVQDTTEEQALTQKIFCEIIDIAKKIGVDFAFPTQTVYHQAAERLPGANGSTLVQGPAPTSPPTAPPN